MGDIADMTLDWMYDDDYVWTVPVKVKVRKRDLMRMIRTGRWRQVVKQCKYQKFTDEDFFVAIGCETLTLVYLYRKGSR